MSAEIRKGSTLQKVTLFFIQMVLKVRPIRSSHEMSDQIITLRSPDSGLEIIFIGCFEYFPMEMKMYVETTDKNRRASVPLVIYTKLDTVRQQLV